MRSQKVDRLLGIIAISIVAALYGLSPVLVKWSNDLVPGPGQVAIRAAMTAVFLLIGILLTKAEWKLISPKASGKWFLWFLFALPFGQILYVIAVIRGGIDAGPAALFYLNTTKVVLTFVLESIVLKRHVSAEESRVTMGKAIVVAAAVIAMGIFAWPNPLKFTMPMLAAMGTGTIEAVSSIAMKKLHKKDSRFVLAFVRFGLSALALPVLLPIVGQPVVFQWVIAGPMLAIAAGAILLSGLSQAFTGVLEQVAYQKIDPDLANILVTTELIWGVIFSVLLIANRVNHFQIIGMSLLIVAGGIAGYMAYRKRLEEEGAK